MGPLRRARHPLVLEVRMSILGFALVLAAAFCHATWNYLVKKLNAGPELIWLCSLLSAAIYLPALLYILVSERPDIGLLEALFIAASAVLHLGYFLLLQQGYRKGDLSLVYPTARATGPLLSASFAVLFLGESLSTQALAGALAIIGGVLGLTGSLKPTSRRTWVSLAFGLCIGCFIASYTVVDAYAVASLFVPPLLIDYATIVGRLILLSPYALKRRGELTRCWQRHRLEVIAIAVFTPLAYILVLYALTFTPVIYVAPTRELSVLLTVLAGSLLLGEGDLRRRLVWAVVILSGVALLATG